MASSSPAPPRRSATIDEYDPIARRYKLKIDGRLVAGYYPRTKSWTVEQPQLPPTAPAPEESCSICLEPMEDPAYVYTLDCCKKPLHCGCLVTWLRTPDVPDAQIEATE